MYKSAPLFLLITCVFCSTLLADQITLKNGDRLSGTVVSSDAKTLTLKTDYAGTIAIQWAAIESLSSSQALYVTSKNGQVTVGAVSTADGSLEVQTPQSGAVRVPRDSVTSIRNQEQQTAHDAEIERLRNPHLLDYWSGSVDSGLALSRGNSDTTTFNLGMKAERDTSRDKISVYSTALFTKSRITGTCPLSPGIPVAPLSCVVTTASAVRGGTRYDLNLTEKLFAFGQLDLEHDRFQDLDLRTVLAGGLGYHAIKNDRTTFDLMAGGAFDHDSFSTGLRRSEPDALVGETLTHKLTKSTALNEAFQFFPNLSDVGEYRFTFDSGISTAINKWLSWQVTYSNRFLSNPVPGIKKNDVLLTTGIHLTFGHKPAAE